MNTKRLRALAFGAAFALALGGCASEGGGGLGGALSDLTAGLTGGGAGTDVEGRSTTASDYDGNRARLAVLRFTDGTGGRATGYRWYSREVGDAMAKKLTSALLATRRFRMVQRQNVDDLMNEINFGASGAVQAGSAAQFGQMVGARLIVTASITDFEDAGGSSAGGRASRKGLLGRLGGATQRTYMAVNLEVVDAQTSEIIASEQIEATVRDVDLGAILGGANGSGAVGGELSSWDKEPKGKALQKVINEAVDYLVDSVPERYFTEAPA